MLTVPFTGKSFRPIAVVAVLLLLARCDLPTEPPRFDLTTGLSAPLLVDKTFVLMGPSETGFDALIDTTSSRFDSIFTVDPANQTIAIVQEMEGFDTELPDGVLPSVDVSPIDVAFSAVDIAADGGEGGSGDEILFRPNGQTFGTSNMAALGVNGVHFTTDADYAYLSAGRLRIESLINEFDVAFDDMSISIPSLRHAPYGPGDTLVVRFKDVVDAPDDLRFHMIERRSGPRDVDVDLTGYRLYARGDRVVYNVQGLNETSNDARTLHSSEELRLAVRIEDAVVSDLAADVDPLEISVTDDVNQDGRLDVLDDSEADVSEFGGLSIFDNLELGELQLAGSELRLRVRTNIAADFALYAVIVGVNEEGEPIYLRGKGSTAVDPSDPLTPPFSAAGSPVQPEHLIRLDVVGASSPDQPAERTVVLNGDNSNVDAFVSQMPTELRMASRIIVEPVGGRVHLREPLLLETAVSTSIPLAVTSGLSINKTFDVNLSDLEDAASDSSEAALEEGELELGYANGLPLGLDLKVDVLDENGDVAISFPKEGQTLYVEPAAADDAGFAAHPSEGTFRIGISRSDLKAISGGEQIRLGFALTTDGDGLARLRATDTFTMRLRGRFDVRVSVD